MQRKCYTLLSHALPALLLTFLIIGAISSTARAQGTDTLWIENWESPTWVNDWYVSNGTWEVGAPTSGPGAAHQGDSCAATVLAGHYPPTTDSRLVRYRKFKVPATSESPRLRFWHWYNFSSWDYGKVQLKVQGSSTWQSISPTYTNNSGAWTYGYADLAAWADSTVEIAFYFHSEPGGEADGWYVDEVAVITGDPVFRNPEGFEQGIGDWSVDGGVWEVGKTTFSHNDSACAATVLAGDYPSTQNSHLISPRFRVPSASVNPRLRFWHWYNFASWDYGIVQLRVQGSSTWHSISPTYSKYSGAWTYGYADLAAWADSTVEIAFYFHSEPGGEADGWYVDEVFVETDCPFIYRPTGPVNVTVSSPGRVCARLPILYADSVTVNNGTWANDTLCFVADSLGAYQFHVVAMNALCGDSCDLTVNVSGVTVGDETVAPGHTVKVPIRLFASDSLLGFTIPLKFSTMQPTKVHLDSVQVDTLFHGSAIMVAPGGPEFGYCRPVQRPPLPPDTLNPYVVAYACFSVDSDAVAEVISIDTTTITVGSDTLSYQFIYASGDTVVPLFVPGSLTIAQCHPPYQCGDFNGDCFVNIADIIYLVNHIFAGGPAPVEGSEGAGDVDCSGQVDITDAVYMVNYIFLPGWPAPCDSCPNPPRLGKATSGNAEVWVERGNDRDNSSLTVHIKSDVAVSGVQLEFSAAGDASAVGLVEGMATFSGQKEGLFKAGLLDIGGTNSIPAGETAVLRLQNVVTGNVTLTTAILVGQDARPLNVVVKETASRSSLPTQYALAQNYPNPFNPTTTISFALPRASQVRLEVFNMLGQKVTTLMDQFCVAGIYTVNWEGTSDSRESVASGVYFYRLKADDYIKTRQMVLLK